MKAISNWLYEVSDARVVLISLFLFVAFIAFVLPSQARSAEAFSGEAGTPDLSFFYTPDQLYEMAEAYGETGRREYIRARFTFDLAWPVVYALLLLTSISWVFKKAFRPGSNLWGLNIVPLLGAGFDYLENISTSWIMFRYPSTTPGIDWLASIFTPLKWVFISAAFVLLVVGAVAAARHAKGGM